MSNPKPASHTPSYYLSTAKIPRTKPHRTVVKAMANRANDESKQQSFQWIGAQYENTTHAPDEPSNSGAARDLEEALGKAISKDKKAKSKAAKHGETKEKGFDVVSRERHGNKSAQAHYAAGLCNSDEHRGQHMIPRQRWQANVHDEPWNNVGQVRKQDMHNISVSRRRQKSTSSTAATKASVEARHQH